MGCKGSRVRIPPRRPTTRSRSNSRRSHKGRRLLCTRRAEYNGRVATVVFADLVGSTGIFERLGDETAGRFVTQLTTALSRTFEQHRGRVVKLLGDGLFVIFPVEG